MSSMESEMDQLANWDRSDGQWSIWDVDLDQSDGGWSIWDDRLEKLFYGPPFIMGQLGSWSTDTGDRPNENPSSVDHAVVQLNVDAAPFIPSGSIGLRPIIGRPIPTVSTSDDQFDQPPPPPPPPSPASPSPAPVVTDRRRRGPPKPDPNPRTCLYCRKKQRPQWNHKDIDWVSGEYRCPALRAAVKRITAGRVRQCEYCVKARPHLANSHRMKCPITKKITCPVMRELPPCQRCQAFGDDIHTNNRCPERPDLDFDRVVKRE